MTTEKPRRLTLGALLHGSGGHIAGWRHPLSPPDGQLDLAHHVRIAQTLERGTFDALFIADVVAIWGHDLDSLKRTARADHFEPLTLLAALSTVTERIGLVATATTTYNEPFHIARKFASLDHLSGGRAGWNVVTSVVPLEAGNFGRDTHLEHTSRYRRAEEFVHVVRALWDSFADGSVTRDQASGLYYDPAGLRPARHAGEHFTVRGPLNISRPPQGNPVLFQAGSSETGKDFAARHGEVVFTAQTSLEGAQAFYTDLKTRAAAHGRRGGEVLVWPVLTPYVASTEREARARLDELQDLVHDDVARRLVQDNIGDLDLTGYPLDGPVPEIGATNRSRSRQDLLLDLARRENLTIRQLALRFATVGSVVGTPATVADHIESWFRRRVADGFNISFPYLPGSAEDFVDQVVPELRRRGLFRAEYEESTLRGHLGLPRPAGRPFTPSELSEPSVSPVSPVSSRVDAEAGTR
ncbi:LLM class flavin-dependent oxidoreductase [Frankia sp. CNm7]|uniref:LLM class flavin-dependent oxidoreductase n=1 Tax=Frankia nepalensis TaxID=1836974 RepID=A0A937US16_9ACTN|nr:LLM class flavin-dependent oxidoreductase [Frankia nepalensis]MBL7498629.1 LLM class flavin-dependent oxidoreductase [Frankia nepalensis]MBL7509205.1 LLM class flavin-dependent oxidoreductase [Frankia nepalensis]MBL7521201.1 LLM class flavin-dependent oxidoreductase [Frankia nepalensis]MBL7628396.1 LLM class flavin-dependent oxidoreductase [Frankia nepalensis]